MVQRRRRGNAGLFIPTGLLSRIRLGRGRPPGQEGLREAFTCEEPGEYGPPDAPLPPPTPPELPPADHDSGSFGTDKYLVPEEPHQHHPGHEPADMRPERHPSTPAGELERRGGDLEEEPEQEEEPGRHGEKPGRG